MCCKKEAMTDFPAGHSSEIISLIIQISLRTNDKARSPDTDVFQTFVKSAVSLAN
jgi:hypothetical protein